MSNARLFSAVGDDRSALNSSEPRGMWTAPAALPVARELGAVAQVDDDRAVGGHLLRLLAGDLRHDGVGGVDELLGGGGHGGSFRLLLEL